MTDHFEQRDQALRAHASQVDPNGVFFAVPSEQLKDIWPWEDYTLAASHAEVQLPESSLDEGLSDPRRIWAGAQRPTLANDALHPRYES